MASFHSAIKDGLKSIPNAALEKVLQPKFKAAGVRDHKAMAKAFAAHLLSQSEQPFEWGSGKNNRIIDISFDDEDAAEIERISSKIVDSIPDIVDKLSKTTAERMALDFADEWRSMRYIEERDLRGFRDRLEDRWGDGLDALRVLLEVSRQLGEQALERLSSSKARKGKIVRSALIQLHVRACQISAEIIVLLENGFADGALARWRTLHEITVVCLLLSDGDDELSRRYLDHEFVESKKAMDRFLIDHESLGFRRPAKREIESVNRAYQRVLSKYGPRFRHEYGWASAVINIERPRFIDLQIAAGKGAMHSHYKMASYSVHATSKALTSRIGTIYSDSHVIAGASNAGLEEAGVKLASSLALVTYTLPSKAQRIDNAIGLLAIANLRDSAIAALLKADMLLRQDDKEIRRAVSEFEGTDIDK